MPLARYTVGHTINNKHEVLELLGEGGMGCVVRVRRKKDGRELALKYCHLRDPVSLKRFRREVRIGKAIKRPHVMPIVAWNLKHDPPYFLMPLADGRVSDNLADYAADEDKAVSAFLEICAGVHGIHLDGAVHRDIKPDNAMIVGGKIVVSDLGLAKPEDRDTTILTESLRFLGTRMFAAPEQWEPGGARDADQRTDVYQLGKTLYNMLTAEWPSLMDPSKLPRGLAHIVRKATKDQPRDRYQTVGELIDAIHVYQQAKSPAANPKVAFESLITRIRDRLNSGEYREADLEELLHLMELPGVRENHEDFLELFDQIPAEINGVLAAEHGEAFTPVLQRYVEAIDGTVGGRSFSYAENVAGAMRDVVEADDATADEKALALEAILMAAVRLNRFAAMDVFNALLPKAQDDDVAMAVAEMLDRREDEYRRLHSMVRSLSLHPAIRAVRDRIAGADAEEEEDEL